WRGRSPSPDRAPRGAPARRSRSRRRSFAAIIVAARAAHLGQPPRQLALGLIGRIEARAGYALREQRLRGDVTGVLVWVLVAAPLLPRPGARAQPRRYRRRAVLAHVLARRLERASGGVGLRREREVDGRLREGE